MNDGRLQGIHRLRWTYPVAVKVIAMSTTPSDKIRLLMADSMQISNEVSYDRNDLLIQSIG